MPRFGAPPVHTHANDARGGQIDWDQVWSDAVHSHQSNAEGGTLALAALLARFVGQDLRTGEYIAPFFGYQEATNPGVTANTLYALPFVAHRAITVDRIAIHVATLAAGASARLGIYQAGTNLYPGSLLLDAGVVSVATTGVKAITISQALAAGLYWLALVSDGAPNVRGVAAAFTPVGVKPTAFDIGYCGWNVAFTYAALPDPFTAGGVGDEDAFRHILLRLLSLD